MTGLPPDDAVATIVACLQRLGIAYFVGGSVASTVHGEIRTTHDIDLVVELHAGLVEPLAACLRADFSSMRSTSAMRSHTAVPAT